MTWKVRLATEQDVETIADFNCRLAVETEEKELDAKRVLSGVRRGMEQGEEVTYFMAEINNIQPPQPIGTLMVTREWSDWRDGWIAWLQSVYVVKEHRGQGVFTDLLDFASDTLARRTDVIGLRLYVENENQRAQAAYLKNGFEDAHYRVLEKLF